jgi:hypothetical protein
MSQLLHSLLKEIGDPNRDDLAVIADSLRAQIQALPSNSRRQLLSEVTTARRSLTPEAEPSWSQHQIVFQLLWQAIGAPTVETEEERSLRGEIKKLHPPRHAETQIIRPVLAQLAASSQLSGR